MHALLECIIVEYANRLRARYPCQKIRSATVFASAIRAFAQYGYIELVNTKTGIRKGIPKFLIDRLKRSSQPIWIPGRNFPVEYLDIYDEMQPYMFGDGCHTLAAYSLRMSQDRAAQER
jgi:hypothetical protein